MLSLLALLQLKLLRLVIPIGALLLLRADNPLDTQACRRGPFGYPL